MSIRNVVFVGSTILILFCMPLVDSRAQDGSAQAKPDDKAKRQPDRIVAYLYGEVTITRAEFVGYLTLRVGAANVESMMTRTRLEFMVNRKIIEFECAKHKISATDDEVEQRFRQDLKVFRSPGLTVAEFEKNILQRFGKTIYEWKEDVIRPKIMMEKLVRAKVKITDAEVSEGFEARYGPKVECRMIVCKKGEGAAVWDKARKSRENFLEEARKQFLPELINTEGKVAPIHRFFGDKKIETVAFQLKEGEISAVMVMNDGTGVILLCEKHVPANASVKLENVREELKRELFEQRVRREIPEVFAEMHRRAAPRLVLPDVQP